MPFNNFLGKFFDPKGLDKQFSSELNILDEPEMPRELRDSLKSNELKEIMSNTQNFMEQSVEYIPNYQDTIDADEERYSDARSHDDAEENDDYMDDPAYSIYRANSRYSLYESASAEHASTSLRSVSNIMMNDISTHFKITKILPVRQNGVIIHWKNLKRYGIRGYKVFVDGHPLSQAHSAHRTSAFIDDIEMSLPHQFAITAVQDENWIDHSETNANLTAIYNYTPQQIILE